MEFSMENQELKEFPFCIVFIKRKLQNFQKEKRKKNAKYHIFKPLSKNLDKKEFSAKIGLRYFLGFIVA